MCHVVFACEVGGRSPAASADRAFEFGLETIMESSWRYVSSLTVGSDKRAIVCLPTWFLAREVGRSGANQSPGSWKRACWVLMWL